MSETGKDSQSQGIGNAALPAGTGSGIPSEMKRQMEAAKERLKRSHAAYGPTADAAGRSAADAPNRSEDR
jgi:hypothetical protein